MTVDQELRRAATSLAAVEVAVPPYARLRRRQRARRATGAVVGAIVALLAVGAVASLAHGDAGSVRVTSEGSSTTAPSTAPPSSAVVPESSPAGAVVAVGALAAESGDHAAIESYLGTPEHVADVTRLVSLAPSEIRPQVETFRAFVAGGGIDPADPDSNVVESFPPPVRAAVEEIQDYVETAC